MHRLRQAAHAIAPHPHPPHDDCSPSIQAAVAEAGGGGGVEEALERDHESFVREGYLRLPDLVTGSLLQRARAAFTASAAPARADWERGLAQSGWVTGPAVDAAEGTWHAPGYFDTPKILEVDDVFLEIVEQPRLVSLAQRILQEDTIHLFQIQARTAPADAPIDADEGYTSWHR